MLPIMILGILSNLDINKSLAIVADYYRHSTAKKIQAITKKIPLEYFLYCWLCPNGLIDGNGCYETSYDSIKCT